MLIYYPRGADFIEMALVLDMSDFVGAVMELWGDLSLPMDLSLWWSLPVLIKYCRALFCLRFSSGVTA